MAKRARNSGVNMPAPYLLRVWLDEDRVPDPKAYPYCIPLLRDGLELEFTEPVTIFVGENGVGKSTLIEGIAALAGYDDAGGGKGYRPVDHSGAVEASGGELAAALRAAWRPKITNGWFFKAESFFAVARYLDEAALQANALPPDFLSHSHGEGFLRFFEERCSYQGIYFFDEPESALSPARQLEFLKLLRRMQDATNIQVIMATHSPLLMACPGARLMQITKYGIAPTRLEDTDHFRLLAAFCEDPEGFLAGTLDD
ncbi:AAA family ATPase [Hyphomicrobium sulfonivorans]|uniref:AAA family ATPase n=1 Tax=Hyphomicrobium sulfonivorans TaxID=121290 RepID=UPI00156F60DE|nr:AAA family ATPase [Hyphomicrobium sulfonivorans]MBI1649281.1 AAA family ATPase [Hyphomicrobium sulfonivorans]NSL73330.1 ATP-binding protein [Hyphomicrobium sulfonivorans]